MAISYWLRPGHRGDLRLGPKIGPFPGFIQLTQGAIRVGPDGEEIGSINDHGDYVFAPRIRVSGMDRPLPVEPVDDMSGCTGGDWIDLAWSDVVVWAEDRCSEAASNPRRVEAEIAIFFATRDQCRSILNDRGIPFREDLPSDQLQNLLIQALGRGDLTAEDILRDGGGLACP